MTRHTTSRQLPRSSRYQPMTDVNGYVVFDRSEHCMVGGTFATMQDAIAKAQRLLSQDAQERAAETTDRLQWRHLDRISWMP